MIKNILNKALPVAAVTAVTAALIFSFSALGAAKCNLNAAPGSSAFEACATGS
ncbi:hypothetical protein L0668_17430 [Paraglaciecola aquimarina]|uniref:Uncharacterized protein n=1 Tax=Paraglaciecola algarum TaxID=3050085 RepID=A0ABS9DC41_9ALTE|nr:hypothetical protein [Paraglaciecola sp. G1-23]MCF2949905.1 hypothetical protein [Paraglaciecola sp. G1-23]